MHDDAPLAPLQAINSLEPAHLVALPVMKTVAGIGPGLRTHET